MSIGQPYQNPNGDTQCDAKGILGEYIIRKTADHTWIAIQLFGAIGSIAATVSGFKKAQVSGDEDKNPSISCKLFLCQSEAPKNNRGCVLILVFEGAIRRMSRCGKKSPPIKPARHRPNLQVTSDAMPHTVHFACAESVFHEQSALSISLAILEAIDGAHLPIFPLRPLPKTSLYLSPLRSRTNLLCGWVRQNCSKPVSTGSRPPLSTKPSGPF